MIPAPYAFRWEFYQLSKGSVIFQHVWMLIMIQQNSDQSFEGGKDDGVCQSFWTIP